MNKNKQTVQDNDIIKLTKIKMTKLTGLRTTKQPNKQNNVKLNKKLNQHRSATISQQLLEQPRQGKGKIIIRL